MPDFLEVPAILSAAVAFLYTLYRRTPVLSQPWRVAVVGSDRYASSYGSAKINVVLYKRFRGSWSIGRNYMIDVGSVAIDDENFDERLVELRFKADEIRRRVVGVK